MSKPRVFVLLFAFLLLWLLSDRSDEGRIETPERGASAASAATNGVERPLTPPVALTLPEPTAEPLPETRRTAAEPAELLHAASPTSLSTEVESQRASSRSAPAGRFRPFNGLGSADELPALPTELLLDPDASPSDLARHYADFGAADLVRTKYRLDAWLGVMVRHAGIENGWIDWESVAHVRVDEEIQDPEQSNFFRYRDAAVLEQAWMEKEMERVREEFAVEPLPVSALETKDDWERFFKGRLREDLHLASVRAHAAYEGARTRERDRLVALGRYESKPYVFSLG